MNANDRDWMVDAACRGTDTDTFYPARQRVDTLEVQTALAVCCGCLVRDACLSYAFAFEGTKHDRFGIYGGLTPIQRNKLARRRYGVRVQQLAHAASPEVVRAWAKSAGYQVATTGTIPNRVRLAYATAMGELEGATA